MKIIEDALKKLQIGQPVLIERIGRGTFQGNIVFLQWLHNYALKWADRLTEYRAYDRRVAILKKQGKGDYPVDQFMSPHLIPNEVYL